MRITRLTLKNWRNFKSVDVTLQKRVFLAGPNAAGKSNFLDAFRFLRDVVSVGGGFGRAVEIRGGISKVRSLYARQKPNIFIGIEMGDDPQKPEWTYSLEFSRDNNSIPIVKKEIVKRDGKILLDRDCKKEEENDPELHTQTHLEQVNANKKFREIADFLKLIRYIHIVPQLVREPGRSTGKTNDPFGGDFLDQLARFQKDKDAYFKSRLIKINKALQVAVPNLKELSLVKDFKGVPHLEGIFEHWRPGAGKQKESDFSDGTLRLFALLWSILDTQGPLLLEEPELSLHADVVRHIPQIFARAIRDKKKNMQIIVSTHSADIFLDPGIGADEILLLNPTDDGTTVEMAANVKGVKEHLSSGLPMSDIIISRTAPGNAAQLSLFGDAK